MDHLDDPLDELEQIASEEQPLTVLQKCAAVGLALLLLAGFYGIMVFVWS